MLSRLEGVVGQVVFHCPPVPQAGRVVSLADKALPFRDAVRQAVQAIDTVPMTMTDSTEGGYRLVVGPGAPINDGLRVYGEAWWGGVAVNEAIAGSGDSSLPFGPYLAASLGVAEVFKAARMQPERYTPPTTAFYSLWTHQTSSVPDLSGPHALRDVKLDYALAGVGAVGCIAIHVLWATLGISGNILLTDADKDGVDVTNLNRYLLFGRAHVGQSKVLAAQNLTEDADLEWHVHLGPLETAPGEHRRILCAVDTNEARQTVQALWPVSLLMASTRDLRAEVIRCDPRNDGPCARCYNEPEVETSDVILRQQFLNASLEEQLRSAEQASVSLAEARHWATTGDCGTAGERVHDSLRGASAPMPMWAVPFVSCAAGTMLAAEAIKEAMAAPVPLSTTMPRATIQFWRPDRSIGAKPYKRDPNCPMCRPDTIAADVWRDRVEIIPSRIE